MYKCIHFKEGKICEGLCKCFKEEPYGVRNNCPDIRRCKLHKYKYNAEKTDKAYKFLLRDSRKGLTLTNSEIIKITSIISEPLKNVQSPFAVISNHPKLGIFKKTLYNYIEAELFERWDITKFTLKKCIKT